MQRPLFSLLICGLALVAGASHAQDTDVPLYDGKWNVRIQGGDSGYQAARVVFSDFAGTWQDVSGKGGHKACRGKKFPITIQRSLANQMEFMVWGSSVSPACPDLSVLLTPTDAKTLEGSIGTDGKVKLTRQ